MKRTYKTGMISLLAIVSVIAVIYGYRYSEYQNLAENGIAMEMVSE